MLNIKISSKRLNNQQILIDNFVNTDTLTTTDKLKLLGLNPIVLGNGNTIIKQYPNQDNKVLIGSKVFLKTNDSYVMPNTIGYSKAELIALCHLLNLKY